jgi:hypothetical protein
MYTKKDVNNFKKLLNCKKNNLIRRTKSKWVYKYIKINSKIISYKIMINFKLYKKASWINKKNHFIQQRIEQTFNK